MQALQKAYKYQIEHGCNAFCCTKQYCNPKNFKKVDTELLSQQLAIMHEQENHICKYLSPVVLNASIEGFVSILNENLVFNSHPTPSDFEIFRIVFNDLKIFQHILITDEKFDFSEYDILVDDKILDDFRMQICTFSDTFELYVPLFCEMLHKQMDCNKYKRSFHFLRGTIIATLFTQFICSLSLINTFDLLIRSILQSDTIRFCRHLLKLPRCLKNFVIVCHNAISLLLLEDVTNVRSDKIHSICLLLQDLSSLSSKTDIFIHEQLSSMLDCKNELNLYNEKKMFSFLYVPAVLTFEFRYKCYFMSNPMLPRRIRLDIRRDHFITDIRQLLNIPKDKLFNNDLNIFFLGESALDLGGVKREFFDLVGRTFGDLRHGLLKKISPEFYWFNDLDCYSDDESWYRILGMIIGMCIRQRTMISIKFPIILYKALLQKEITRIDLIEIYPELIKNLDKLAKFNNLEINELDLRFSVTTTNEMTNESKDIPLIENGCEIKVTEANVNQYVNEYFLYLVKNLLNKNYYSFYTGFKRIVGDNLCNWFSPEDIALMVSGDDDINWVVFQNVMKYSGGYFSESQTVRCFWNIFHNKFTNDERKKLLYFFTGLRGEPIEGFENINMTIERSTDLEVLPIAHTCTMTLVIPDFMNEKILEDCLRVCIKNCEGFGFI